VVPTLAVTPGDVVIANAQDRCITAKYVYLRARIFGARLAGKEQLRLQIAGAPTGMFDNASSAFLGRAGEALTRIADTVSQNASRSDDVIASIRYAIGSLDGPKPRERTQPGTRPLNRSATR
jgi:hypothetical protein